MNIVTHLRSWHRALLALLPPTALILGTMGVAHATIPRVRGSWLFGPYPVWSDGTTNPAFRPMSDPLESKGILSVRVSTEMSEDSGACKIRPALRYSNNGVDWDPPKEIVAAYRATEGIDWGSTYIDISQIVGTPARAYVQFGVQVANESGTTIQLCNATIRVEPKELIR